MIEHLLVYGTLAPGESNHCMIKDIAGVWKTGYLKGKQPLLPFFLNLIELKAGSNILLRRSLKEPEDKEKSFFAMIALEENDELLSARAQGGEVVIWLKD